MDDVLYSFKGGRDACCPFGEEAPLVFSQGLLYGTTMGGGGATRCALGCGTVFDVSKTGAETVLHRFQGQPDGANPSGALIALNGKWYGMTAGGGSSNKGAVFSVDRSGNEHVVYSFKGGSDGSTPFGRLLALNGVLYGTTVEGGHAGCTENLGCGTVFQVSSGGAERVLYRFKGPPDAANPYVGLIELGGTLYGTSVYGGAHGLPQGFGSVFAISTGGKERVVYSFKDGRDGALPQSPLISVAGKLYGTTTDGGSQQNVVEGVVFEVSPAGAERVLYRFSANGSQGRGPQAQLLYRNGELYGTAAGGGIAGSSLACGVYGCGTIFELALSSGKLRVLYRFEGPPDGYYPTGGLTEIKGTFYGTTEDGGKGPCYSGTGCGTVFAFTPALQR